MNLDIRVDKRHVQETTGRWRNGRILRDREGHRCIRTLGVVLKTDVSEDMVGVRMETNERDQNDATREVVGREQRTFELRAGVEPGRCSPSPRTTYTRAVPENSQRFLSTHSHGARRVDLL